MATRPYFLLLETTLSGNGTGTVSYTLPQNETLELFDIRIQSTGIFNITDIRDSSGNHLTNASPAVEIPSVLLQAGTSPNIGIQRLPSPIVIDEGKTFYIDLEDSSGSGNTVTILLLGNRSNN